VLGKSKLDLKSSSNIFLQQHGHTLDGSLLGAFSIERKSIPREENCATHGKNFKTTLKNGSESEVRRERVPVFIGNNNKTNPSADSPFLAISKVH
jgi:hypothetical protein